MNRDGFLSLYDKLITLVEKLPGGLQKPILRELTPIRGIFLEQRPARILLVGQGGSSAPQVLRTVSGRDVQTGASEHGWREYRVPELGAVYVLDARDDASSEFLTTAFAHAAPDLALWTAGGEVDPAIENHFATAPNDLPLVVAPTSDDAARARLASRINASRVLCARPLRLCDSGDNLAEAICPLLPPAAQLEFARLTGAREAQARIAGSLLKSFTAVCGVIGLQPIPLADMPILTTLQTLMVSMIIHASGKPASVRLVAEFLGALGLNIGAGMVFRESARALIKIVPFWGNAVSGIVAGAGTYAIGRASIAYFIEDIPLTETRKLFHRLLPSWDAFKRRRLPRSQEKPPPLPPE